MIVFQSNVTKAKKKSFTRYIGVTRIFDWRGGPNRKSHAMTLSEFFEKRDFLWDKDIINGGSEVGAWVGTRWLLSSH